MLNIEITDILMHFLRDLVTDLANEAISDLSNTSILS